MRSTVSLAMKVAGHAHDRALLASQLGDGEAPDPADQAEVAELPDVGAALDELPPRLRTVLVQRFGLDEKPPKKLRKVAEALSVTRSRVLERALVRLHRSCRKPGLTWKTMQA